MSIQIMGQRLDLAFKELNIKAVKMYETKGEEVLAEMQVWELEKEEYNKLNSVKGSGWKDDYGWWRNNGCNCENDEKFQFIVNNNVMIGFKNEHSWYHNEDEIKEDPELSPPEYKNFSSWFTEYISLSKLYNYTYFVHSLAKINGFTKAEFLQKFEG